ncbi:MAG: thiamine pyrophosphate-requiring protein, partial [Chloroflexi bacterium]|nr:thiamine pyrophosphate-requiring protein [Chloroflexota bacterium]
MEDQTSKQETTVPVDFGGEAFLETLNNNGVEYVFINSGTDTFPIQEAAAKYQAEGKRIPKFVLCPDESTAVAAAHGYFNATRKPQVVLVHVDAGTLQLSGGLHNAQRGRAGMVLCAGRAPMTFDGEMDGSRSSAIHWTQEQLDQAGSVRNFTKWDYELRRNENVHHVMQRAFQVAASEPPGPVYLMLPREVLMEKMESTKKLPVQRYAPPTTPQADLGSLRAAAEALAQAENPLIIAGQSGRNQSSVAAMTELAELVGAPVITDAVHLNFPTDHDLWAGGAGNQYIAEADVILTIDSDVPYIPIKTKPRPDAQLIHIDIDPIKPSIPMWVFPTDSLMHADSSKAIPALNEMLNEMLTEADRARIEERIETIKDRHQRRRQENLDLVMEHSKRDVITPQWLSHCISEAIDEDTVLLDETVTNSGNVANYIPRSKPGTLYKSGGSSLGWAIGAAMGVKMAEPDKTVVALTGDGAFIYGCPTSTLWTADVYDFPFLTVIYNNQIHNSPKASLIEGYP